MSEFLQRIVTRYLQPLEFVFPLAWTVLIALVVWLAPQLTPADVGIKTPQGYASLIWWIGMAHLVYLAVGNIGPGWGRVGNAADVLIDMMVSGLPLFAASVVYLLHVLGFWPISDLLRTWVIFTLWAALFDLILNGAAKLQISRLMPETKMTQTSD